MQHELAPRRRRGSLIKFGLFWLLLGGVAGSIAFQGFASRQAQSDQLAKRAETQAVQTVTVIPPTLTGNVDRLELPGRLDAYIRAPLYARVSGYVSKWTSDIGAKVKAGQLLAEIDAPELDQQLLQARSQLKDAEAAAELADITSKRFQALLPSSFVSRQNADEKSTDATSKQAQVKSLQANVERLKALADFKKIVAPFDGVVTARNTDVGALTTSGSSTGAPLFVVAEVSKLRLYVNVPQTYVPSITIGSTAEITVPEYPKRTFSATVEATSQSVDAASGTTQMLLVVSNENGELLSGGFANVRFKLPHNDETLQIPSSALIFDGSGLRVATVDSGNRVVMKPIKIGRDFGKAIELASGLSPSDKVIDSPPDGLLDGDPVHITGPEGETTAPTVVAKGKDGSGT
jgi:membrane fusion protein, multidrug efflux system